MTLAEIAATRIKGPTLHELDEERRERGLVLMACQDETATVVNGAWFCHCPTPGHNRQTVVWYRGQAHYRRSNRDLV